MSLIMKPEGRIRIPKPPRLVVAADYERYEEGDTEDALARIKDLAYRLKDEPVIVKVNAEVFYYGAQKIAEYFVSIGCPLFLDLKLNEIPATLDRIASYLRDVKPAIVTVSCQSGVDGLKRLRESLSDVAVFGVTFLTSLSYKDVMRMYDCDLMSAVLNFADIAREAGLDGIVAAPREVRAIRERFGDALQIMTPNIRPEYLPVQRDDQDRVRSMTPCAAIRAGAQYLVVGRPVTESRDPLKAVGLILSDMRKCGAVL